jgi:NAD(P)-dependent dehydrogenase (short-subunit alcohol dehydrogenase family)
MQQPIPAAIVTGSTSGIGLAIARRLLRGGYRVVLNYAHDDQRAAAAHAECAQLGPDVLLVKASVADSADVRHLFATTEHAFGRLDVLINNAALVVDRPVLDMKEHDWDLVLDTNLKGAFLCAQHAARQMLTQESGGSIINIASSTGIRARRNGANTCAAKAGMILLTQALALELAPRVRVNSVIPGLTLTDETVHRFGLDQPPRRAEREAAIPMGRLGMPDDVADGVMLLLSDDAAFITGQKIFIDGGQNMW